jgi:hypothetical protein
MGADILAAVTQAVDSTVEGDSMVEGSTVVADFMAEVASTVAVGFMAVGTGSGSQ